ncbi:MAG: hypothetical protein WDN04_25510 [Rhodospirillales bacterium]
MRRFLAAFLAVIPLAGNAQPAPETSGGLPYGTLTKPLSDFMGLPPPSRDKLIFIERVVSRAGTPLSPPPRLTIFAAGGALVVPVAADGTVTLPLTAALRAENPTVGIDQPRGTMSLEIILAVAPPPHLRMPYTWFVSAGAQARDAAAIAAHSNAGLLASLFAPRLRGLAISFAPGSRGQVFYLVGASREVLSPGANGTTELRLDRKQAEAEVEFSAAPTLIEPLID